MSICNRMCRWISLFLLCLPLVSQSATPVKSIVIFGDSMSDNGNTTHLLKSIRQDESPAYLVAPFKKFVINKMVTYADAYYVPQMVLDAGLALVTNFFDTELAPYIANLITRVKTVPVLPGEPYWNARFSNGRVWNEYLAEMLSIQRDEENLYDNKAFGGSWAATYDHQLTVWNLIRHPIATVKTLIVGKLIPPSLGLTVQAYLLVHPKVNQDSVFFMFSGFNDYLNILQFEDNYNPAIMSVYVDNVLENFSASVLQLAQAGASHFVIMSVPHIGNMPKYARTSDRVVLNAAIDTHNERLQKRIKEWKKMFPNVDVLFVNTDQSLANALLNPEKYGFTNVRDACIDVKFPMYGAFTHSPFANNYVLRQGQVLHYHDEQFLAGEKNYHKCETPSTYLFWDEIHPSTLAHSYLAVDICTAMKTHGYDVNCKQIKPTKLAS